MSEHTVTCSICLKKFDFGLSEIVEDPRKVEIDTLRSRVEELEAYKVCWQDLIKDNERLMEICNKSLSELARLREQVRWIPVGERLPETIGWVIVRNETGEVYPGYHMNEKWHDDFCQLERMLITHWMNLPQPPEVNNE